ncbi:MAG: hypothetical protein A3B44_03505 [Candidatus Levybacteria bacterium RIFCSPLOWO2_01_FULL_38_21]|nr:MAG: hypothetical protein A3B44_03505 [Candidatus Levybacteria bacterium RIFCSPLOWO2_01_FULL_38_21]
MIKLGAKDLRTVAPSEKDLKKIKKNPIYIILDNVLDTYNVGGIFRLADAVSAKKVFLCGETETPPHTRIKKASINTSKWVSWQYSPSAKSAIDHLRLTIDHLKVIAIEQSPKSVPYDKIDYQFPLALIVGHESKGVSKDVLKLSDFIAEIPMWGVNKSLNVIVSLGIVLYEATRKI